MQAELGMHYAECQLDAIKAPLNSHVVIITGGPGTGKTTTLNGAIAFQKMLNPKIKILCAAPTGRAAQRMNEATGMPATTVHRLLEVVPQDGLLAFAHNAQNPLDCDLLVVDEFSMVDIVLFGALMRAIKPTTKVIFVGDSNQLPSVGPGSVLKDMIESKIVPAIELQIVFRQDSSSLIAINADLIKKNDISKIQANKSDGNFFVIKTKQDNNEIKQRTLTLFKSYLDEYTKKGMVDAVYQVQILCPVKKETYPLSVNALNPELRNIANPPKPDRKKEYRNSKGQCIFREGDKIMQKRNNYEKDAFNGDLGIIQKIDLDAKEIVVKFQFKDDLISYSFSEIGEIELAYATTIHKSQGSEYACTIIPMSPEYNGQGFNSKNLLYTGITRAKKVFYFVGDLKAMMYGLKNTTTTNRCTTLRQRISGEHRAIDIAGMELLGLIEPQALE
jgi:exodeoxyribonuclease V alpha subunit